MFSMFSSKPEEGKTDAPTGEATKQVEGTEAQPTEVKKEETKGAVAAETPSEEKKVVPAPDVDVSAAPSDVTKKDAEKVR